MQPLKIEEICSNNKYNDMGSDQQLNHDVPSAAKQQSTLNPRYYNPGSAGEKQQRKFKHYPFVVEWQLNNADPE